MNPKHIQNSRNASSIFRFVLQVGCNLIMNSPTKIEAYSPLETLLSRLFNCHPQNGSFHTEVEEVKAEYLASCDSEQGAAGGAVEPKELVEVKKNLHALSEVNIRQDDDVCSEQPSLELTRENPGHCPGHEYS